MRLLPLILAIFTLALAAAQPGETMPPPQPTLEIYTFAQLISKADQIVLAEVGASKEGQTDLAVQQVIKAPYRDPGQIDQEMIKRAEALLKDENLAATTAALKVSAAKGMKLPQQGTQAVFFLWEKAGAGAYRITHPQCIYDSELVVTVRVGVREPRKIAEGKYLREWDQSMAEKLKRRETEEALVKSGAGEAVDGLKIRALGPITTVSGDGSFTVKAIISNTRTQAQVIYDGPAGGYGAVLKPKNPEKGRALVLRLSMKELAADTDGEVLRMTDMMDFASIAPRGTLSKDLLFESKEFPALKQIDAAEYVVSVFYSTNFDGKKTELATSTWTGSVISEFVPLSIAPKETK